MHSLRIVSLTKGSFLSLLIKNPVFLLKNRALNQPLHTLLEKREYFCIVSNIREIISFSDLKCKNPYAFCGFPMAMIFSAYALCNSFKYVLSVGPFKVVTSP